MICGPCLASGIDTPCNFCLTAAFFGHDVDTFTGMADARHDHRVWDVVDRGPLTDDERAAGLEGVARCRAVLQEHRDRQR